MTRALHSLTIVAVVLLVSRLGAEPVPLATAQGKVEKASKDTLVFQPRDESGKFGKSVSLHVTGTSKVWLLSSRAGKDKKGVVLVQKEGDAKDLEAGQLVAVIYATPKGQDPVLLSAVVQPEK